MVKLLCWISAAIVDSVQCILSGMKDPTYWRQGYYGFCVAAPEKPKDYSYEDLKQMVKTHHNQKPSVMRHLLAEPELTFDQRNWGTCINFHAYFLSIHQHCRKYRFSCGVCEFVRSSTCPPLANPLRPDLLPPLPATLWRPSVRKHFQNCGVKNICHNCNPQREHTQGTIYQWSF